MSSDNTGSKDSLLNISFNLLISKSNISYSLSDAVSRNITIGRKDLSENPDIDLGPYDSGPYISRNQGYFSIQNDALFYYDKSKNGTLVNGRQIKNGKIELKNKDKVRFGNIDCEVLIK